MEDTVEEIALGFTRNLTRFKKVVPLALDYEDMELDPYLPDFANRLLEKMALASRIHFDLTDMRFLNTPDGVLHGPKQYLPLGSTNWELRTIWDKPEFKVKTTFYLNGRILSLEEIEALH